MSTNAEDPNHSPFPDEAVAAQKARDRASFIVSLPKWIALAMIAWQIRLSIEALVGKNAVPALLERFGREVSYWEIVCWLAGILGILFGLYSRWLLRRQLEKDSLNITILERRLNAAILPGSSILGSNPTGKP